MKVVGFAGYSGAGKTTLVEQVIALLRARGLRVSVVKHAHHRFDVDRPGKDSWRHRQAGAFEVLVVSDQRLALMREFEQPGAPDIHAMLAELDAGVDWVLVEGFKHGDLPKIEVWRAPAAGEEARPLRCTGDPGVLALATDDPALLPAAVPAQLPLLDLNQPGAVAEWLLADGARFEYRHPHQES
ncbi:molybdopterin-guanine dinucleotide biosynthesis protein B [Comamonas endophytica]|uniref:Molybdopterin-guanine dinucleotide biosynthesis protein B n=1 Tax=Comamonas endophytica TaxID=2949090 RepID=A0ABY6GDK1_9BURK|nr:MULTISPECIES: molybdopterin-guanine dinucleotide biosynthesis protein B [unclassified Acidovorax]MCD2513557.1 molybdopterin-guanine dinucleotide biosynthesis protein B [Acidovorax sp. D4N7]UYG52432.1 molybdopterin-guanine dinucleotide biosynthesis protein B [Acidovorax sp. 5MLIR]